MQPGIAGLRDYKNRETQCKEQPESQRPGAFAFGCKVVPLKLQRDRWHDVAETAGVEIMHDVKSRVELGLKMS